MPQQLNSKDQANFRSLVRLYESKQYKKAIKTADQILKKNQGHGETEAMKALTLNSQGKHADEAFALGKQALQHDMKSHITWHVYGLLWRSVKNYDEAIRAYKMALRIEPESAQILRDLAFLQAQMRDFQGYISSRKLMLQAKPTVRQNWTALAVAHHLAGQLPQAENMLKTYEGTLKEKPAISDIENSEAVLYHNMIIEEMGETERALEHLNKIYDTSLDRTSVMEAQARLYLKLEKWDEAEKAYRALVERNNEYRLYYEELEKAMRLDRSKESDIPKLIELYESFASQNQRLDAARRIPLNFLTGSQFREAADKYLRRFLTKGVPSTFTNVKGLYEDESKRKVIFELVQGYLESAKKSSSDEKTNGDKPDRTRESSLYFLAQHYNYYITRDLPKALQYIDQVLESEPKNVVYLQTKARIYKHFGNVTKAAETMGVAREADDSDRYLNTKFAKYQLRNHENEAAITTMSRFTRNEAVGGALGDLHDMQCMWYLAEDGESYLRQGKLGLALKRFKSIYEIFDVWYEDQFDFHFFSLRKGAVRAYIDLLRWEDRLREHPFFTRAALKAVKIYTAIFDNPNLAGPQVNGDIDLDKLDPVERKKALKKAKKDQEKREKVEAERRESERRALLKTKTQKKDADAETKPADDDPNGNKLLETKTPLEDAMPYISLLLEFSPKLIVSQFAGFDVYVRKNKLLLALKCLNAAHQINPKDPGLHERLIRFRKALDSSDATDPKVSQVIKSCSSFVPASADLKKTNDAYLSSNKSSPQHIFSGLRARALLDSSSGTQNAKDLNPVADLPSLTLTDATAALELFKTWKSDKQVVQGFKDAMAKRFPEATVFKA